MSKNAATIPPIPCTVQHKYLNTILYPIDLHPDSPLLTLNSFGTRLWHANLLASRSAVVFRLALCAPVTLSPSEPKRRPATGLPVAERSLPFAFPKSQERTLPRELAMARDKPRHRHSPNAPVDGSVSERLDCRPHALTRRASLEGEAPAEPHPSFPILSGATRSLRAPAKDFPTALPSPPASHARSFVSAVTPLPCTNYILPTDTCNHLRPRKHQRHAPIAAAKPRGSRSHPCVTLWHPPHPSPPSPSHTGVDSTRVPALAQLEISKQQGQPEPGLKRTTAAK